MKIPIMHNNICSVQTIWMKFLGHNLYDEAENLFRLNLPGSIINFAETSFSLEKNKKQASPKKKHLELENLITETEGLKIRILFEADNGSLHYF